MPRKRRPSFARWAQIRRKVWERDGGQCQGPYCRSAPPLTLEEAHIDHRIPVSAGGDHTINNLRVLCRRCHVLRADHAHAGMIANALRDGIIPADWRRLVWMETDLPEQPEWVKPDLPEGPAVDKTDFPEGENP